jgi:GT2 family glycosyltransferase
LARYEESELSMRLQRAGFEIWWLPEARILHLIPASRLNLCWLSRTAFNEGRSVALMRLRRVRRKSARISYLFGRLVLVPIHCTLNLLVAGLSFPFRPGQIAARSLLRAIRIAGQGWQLLLETGRTLFRPGFDG